MAHDPDSPTAFPDRIPAHGHAVALRGRSCRTLYPESIGNEEVSAAWRPVSKT